MIYDKHTWIQKHKALFMSHVSVSQFTVIKPKLQLDDLNQTLFNEHVSEEKQLSFAVVKSQPCCCISGLCELPT